MLEKINRLKNWKVALLITVAGFLVYSTGLFNAFQGDDTSQIVNSIPVHSIAHIRLFFEGSTFYNGQGLKPLTGYYFRPLMLVVYSLIYTLFRSYPIFFHIIQLALCIGSTYLLYLILKGPLKRPIALVMSLLFLIIPINSQAVFEISSLDDVLFFFFGILALYLLINRKSNRSLLLVVGCLFLSLLSKESGILFILLSCLYLYWYNRKRLVLFALFIIPPLIIYAALRIHAIGLFTNPHNAPIDNISLLGRIMTAPSIMLMYLTKFIFPIRLAANYYWIEPKFSITHVLIPLVVDIVFAAIIVYFARRLYQDKSRAIFQCYIFFAIWFALGMALLLQVVPLDMTFSENWFYFPSAGLLGMIGVLLSAYPIRINAKAIVAVACVIVLLCGIRTAIRGVEWRNEWGLDYSDIAASSDNYIAENDLALYFFNKGNYPVATRYVTQSIKAYPYTFNYNTYGQILYAEGSHRAAGRALKTGMKYGNLEALYDNMAIFTVISGSGTKQANEAFLQKASRLFPFDSTIWYYSALEYYKNHQTITALNDITKAYNYDQSSEQVREVYNIIMSNEPPSVIFGSQASTQ